jgi:hypothetical protein
MHGCSPERYGNRRYHSDGHRHREPFSPATTSYGFSWTSIRLTAALSTMAAGDDLRTKAPGGQGRLELTHGTKREQPRCRGHNRTVLRGPRYASSEATCHFPHAERGHLGVFDEAAVEEHCTGTILKCPTVSYAADVGVIFIDNVHGIPRAGQARSRLIFGGGGEERFPRLPTVRRCLRSGLRSPRCCRCCWSVRGIRP